LTPILESLISHDSLSSQFDSVLRIIDVFSNFIQHNDHFNYQPACKLIPLKSFCYPVIYLAGNLPIAVVKDKHRLLNRIPPKKCLSRSDLDADEQASYPTPNTLPASSPAADAPFLY